MLRLLSSCVGSMPLLRSPMDSFVRPTPKLDYCSEPHLSAIQRLVGSGLDAPVPWHRPGQWPIDVLRIVARPVGPCGTWV
eukprot:scaffold143_cov154-Amphora_coffeaeformis.AAC.9